MKKKLFNIIANIIIIIASLLLMIWIKPGSGQVLLDFYSVPIISFLIIWISISILGRKHRISENQNLLKPILKIIIIDFSILALCLIIIYITKISITSRLVLLGTCFTAMIMEILYYLYIKTSQKQITTNEYSSNFITATLVEEKTKVSSDSIPEFPIIDIDIKDSIHNNLKNKFLSNSPRLFEWISSKINLFQINKHDSYILKSKTFFNIENIDSESLKLLVNIHRINDILRINRYFIQINKNLVLNGYFIGCVETISLNKRKVFIKYPVIINSIVYITRYITRRVFPKLPITKQIYFFFTGGYNRALSTAETYGRLYSCGFKVIEEKHINSQLFFIARKVKEPIYHNTPSYGPLCKFNRVGLNGNIVQVLKIRTMFPFSEFLQEYVYDKNKLDDGGKFKNDFRITRSGHIMRRLWIDELPMIINLLKGELKIVGVRPLSKQYFGLYPEEFQKRRIKYKPGLIPPFYVDLPKTIDEIIESENKYFDLYDKNPYITDIKYFFIALFNILIKKARSG